MSIQGFLIGDYAKRFPEGIEKLSGWLADGKLTYTATVMDGFESLPDAFVGLFEGKNEGKMMVKV